MRLELIGCIDKKYINLVIVYVNTFNLLVLLQKSDLFNLCMTDKMNHISIMDKKNMQFTCINPRFRPKYF